MKINFAMWRKASWELIKMDDKNEWSALDVVSKWLIATRSAVTLVTVYSCVISGLLAWRDGYFSWGPWLILTFGLFIAHGANNLLNDYTDFSRGLDPCCRILYVASSMSPVSSMSPASLLCIFYVLVICLLDAESSLF